MLDFLLVSKTKAYFRLILVGFLFFGTTLLSQQKKQTKLQEPPAKQAPAKQASADLKIVAQTQEKHKEKIFASGNVEVHYKEIKLFADKVEVNTQTKDVSAEGNVSIQTPGEVISAEKIFFNLESSQGKLDEVMGMMQPTIFYEAKSVVRKTDSVYSLEKARLTSCVQPVPRWNFSCAKANFKKNDYVEMWSAVFSIKKIPVFYWPYLRYPLNKERATGFLMPQLGYSGSKGFIYEQSFYWVLRQNIAAAYQACVTAGNQDQI